MRLLLDCDVGSLTVKKNGTLFGRPVSSHGGLKRELCWVLSCKNAGTAVRIKTVEPDDF